MDIQEKFDVWLDKNYTLYGRAYETVKYGLMEAVDTLIDKFESVKGPLSYEDREMLRAYLIYELLDKLEKDI